MSELIQKLKRGIKKRVLRLMNVGAYEFMASHYINEQSFKVKIGQTELNLVANHACPLYETITEIIDYDCYFLDIIKEQDFSKDVCIDIGANVGTFSIIASTHCFSKVYAFEPIQSNYEYLLRNIQNNKLSSRITPFKMAVSDYSGKVKFNFNADENVGSHMLDLQHELQTKANIEEVDCISAGDLSNLVGNENIGLLKLDCEGSEYRILSSLNQDVYSKIKYITMEVHDLDKRRNLPAIVRILSENGFTCITKPDIFNRRSLNHLLASNNKLGESSKIELKSTNGRKAIK